jgi:glutamate 5-kinase
VPIINENDTVATHEIRFGDNDRLAALVAHLVHADELHLLSDVDFLYSGNPSDPTSRPIERISTIRELDEIDTLSKSKSGVGTGGMSTKVEAARIAMSAGISVYLSSAKNAMSMVKGESVGTFFAPSMSKTPSRLLWLAHASSPRGVLQLDPGAVIAVVDRRVSLLPAGVTSVSGEFAAGDPVDLAGPDGKVVARGLVAFDSEEIPRMLGKSTKELAQTFGAEFERELVHRDDLVLL